MVNHVHYQVLNHLEKLSQEIGMAGISMDGVQLKLENQEIM